MLERQNKTKKKKWKLIKSHPIKITIFIQFENLIELKNKTRTKSIERNVEKAQTTFCDSL